MRYLGGKSRISKWVVENLKDYGADCHTYLEPFMGSGAVFKEAAPLFKVAMGSDGHEDLMMMWKALQSGWEPPRHVSRERYHELKASNPSAERGLVGFGSSFGGKWFGGYVDQVWDKHHSRMTKPYLNAAVDSVLKVIRARPDAILEHKSFDLHNPSAGWIVYCDPPYSDTTGYGGVQFDAELFWSTASSWVDRGAKVVVSEQKAPPDWVVLNERTRKHMLKSVSETVQEDRREALFMRST